VFILGSETAFDVTEWWVSVDNTSVDKLLQVSEVSSFAESVNPSSAESKSAEVLLERVEELARTTGSDLRRVVDAVVLDHVVRAVHVVVYVAFAS